MVSDGKTFCCNGCKTVYEILRESNACEYYSIEDHPGIRADTAGLGNRFAYLDNEEIARELLEFSDGGISKVRFFIPSIHCSSCIWLLENLHRIHKGVIHSSVNFVRKEVTVTFNDHALSLRRLVELLASISYVPQITLSDLDRKKARTQKRRIYYQLGIAGFCFGNIMLFSAPDYLAGSDPVDQGFIHNFAYFNLVLSLPVVFYAGLDYFIAAIKGLRKKIVTIDFPIALGIAVLFLRSAYDILSQSGPGFLDSLSGLVFFLLIGKWYQGKTYQALSFERDYKSYFPVAVTIVQEDGTETTKPLKHLRPGERIVVRNQELVPADAILIKGNANIDYSFVSGESTPVPKKLKERIYAGGRQVGSSIELIIEKEVVQSYLTDLWNQDLHGKEERSQLNTLINVVSRYFTFAVVLIAMAAGIYWYFADPSLVMNAFTAVLIVACPCALALTVPFTFGNSMRIFGRHGLYLKKTSVVEHLSKIDTIVFDKTGTITCSDIFETDFSELNLNDEERSLLRSAARHSTHPLSQALFHSLQGDITDVDEFNEIPAQGIEATAGGHTVKAGSHEYIIGETPVAGIYSSQVFVSVDGEERGSVKVRHKYRPGLEKVIGELGSHFGLHLLSGDNNAERPYLKPLFGSDEAIHFRQTPKDKLFYVRRLKEKNKHILMVGDGLNDAGALKESDVGITIADNVYHFSPACDGILDAQNFSRLPWFLSYTKKARRIVYAGFAISFVYNIVGISFAASGMLTPLVSAILMPLSSVSVVAFATLATSLSARNIPSLD